MCTKNSCLVLAHILLSASLTMGSGSGCSITNISHIFDDPSTIFIQWELSQDCLESQDKWNFRVSAHHLKYLACNKNNIQNTIISWNTYENSITLRNLFPYSTYKIEIVDLSSGKIERTVEIDTPSGKPQFSPINVELWGDDPWVRGDSPLRVERRLEIVPEYYAEKLLPYTSYKLRVFALNAQGVYNSLLFLELPSRTLPTVPLAPQEIQALSIDSSSVRLLWTPRYPPNGLIKKHILRMGIYSDSQTDSILWKKMFEVFPSNNTCKGGSVCHIVYGLTANTTYLFQVQVENENINQLSEFSESAIVKTDPLPIASTTPFFASESTQPQSETSIDQQGQELVNDSGSTNRIIIIVLTPLAIIAVVVVCAILLYKVKMRELKIIYHQSQLIPPESFLGSPGFPHLRSFSVVNSDSTPFGTTQRSKSISGHIFGPGMGSSACGISTTSFIHSPPIQLEEIQNRQLPEPPIQQDTDLYCQIESDSAIDINSSNTIQHDLLGSLRSTEEVTDNYGYLKPTFNRSASGIDMTTEISSRPIPILSYDSRVRMSSSSTMLNELANNYHIPRRNSISDLAENATYIPFNMLKVKHFEGHF